MLALAVLGAIALSFPAPGPTAIDTAATNFVRQLPGLIGWFWEVAYALLIIWSLALLVLALFANGRKRLFLYELLAGALALGIAILVAGISGTDPSSSLQGMINSDSPPVYLATRIAIATAVIVTASPDLTRPMRAIGRWLIGIGGGCRRTRYLSSDRGCRRLLDRVRFGGIGPPPGWLTRRTAHPRPSNGSTQGARRRRNRHALHPLQPRG